MPIVQTPNSFYLLIERKFFVITSQNYSQLFQIYVSISINICNCPPEFINKTSQHLLFDGR